MTAQALDVGPVDRMAPLFTVMLGISGLVLNAFTMLVPRSPLPIVADTPINGRVRGALIAAQFALSLAVLVAAGLFLRRLDERRQVDVGFGDPAQVVLASVDFELARVPPDGTRRALVERLVEQLSVLPGVRAAAAASFVPLGFLGYYALETQVDGHVPRPGESMTFLTNMNDGGGRHG
jgi:hypothetical protein